MKLLSKDELRNIAEVNKGPCISIYLPAHRVGWAPEIRQDQIRFKNLLREAKEQLLATGLRNTEVAELTDPIHKLIDDDTFWLEHSDGIALFSSPEMLRYYRLPINFDGLELATVNDKFHIKPLLPLFANDGRFFILALSRNAVKLLECTHFSVKEVKLPKSVPHNINQTLKYEEREQQEHPFSGRPERGSKRTDGGGFDSTYHGAEADEKNELLRYFQEINKGLHEIFREEHAPLILAGVDYLLPIYKTANSYRYIVDEVILGNSEERSEKDLQERGWAIIEPLFLKTQQKHLAEYEEYAAKGQASADFKDIVRAAYQGRIDVLFVANGVQRWGRYDPDTNSVFVHDEKQQGDEDLLDFAATETILKGGAVYALDNNKVPNNGPLAAIFRYMKIATAGLGTKGKTK